jgi:hypothetical protein
MSSTATCLACGEQGHKSSKCKSIAIPPEGFYTGGGGGGGHSHDDDDETCSISLKMPCRQGSSKDGEIQSRLQMRRAPFRVSPNRFSNAVVQEA